MIWIPVAKGIRISQSFRIRSVIICLFLSGAEENVVDNQGTISYLPFNIRVTDFAGTVQERAIERWI